MSIAKIHGAEYPICDIFGNKFAFHVPLYQRPYAWTTEHAGALLSDLLDFVGQDSTPVDDLSPYFLGSIVLIKQEHLTDAQIVDGQQRLTTLTILFSALRSLVSADYADDLKEYIYEKGRKILGTTNRYRLTLRERDADFFRTYIQEDGQINKLKGLDPRQLTDSRRNIRANALHFLERLAKLPEPQRERLAEFIANQCLLVVVTTPDLDSAYRIFSILNDRGMDLSHSDILKSEIVGKIPDDLQEGYNDRWEDAEDELGRKAFSDLFAHIRMIFRKAKQKESILKEFREFVVKNVGDSKFLIDKVLIPFADAYAVIKNTAYESTEGADAVNRMLKWLNRIDNFDWLPPAITFLAKHKAEPKLLLRLVTDLERLTAYLMALRYGINERIERYGKVLDAFAKDADLFAADSPLQLTEAERKEFLTALDGDVYREMPRGRLYVLLRLDSAVSDASATYDYGVVTIEHVLPQSPKSEGQWCKWFPTQEQRDEYVHRLGNLMLLNQRKNSSASNADFSEKKKAYFKKGGVSAFPLTTQALAETEWTEEVVARQAGPTGRKAKGTVAAVRMAGSRASPSREAARPRKQKRMNHDRTRTRHRPAD